MKSRLVWSVFGFLCWTNVALAQKAKDDKPLVQKTISVSGQEDKVFHSLQEAIDAAPSGAVINLGTGQFNDRVIIKNPITLVGAGADATTLGPTKEEQTRLWDEAALLSRRVEDTIRAAEDARPRKQLTEEEADKAKQIYEKTRRLVEICLQPVVLVEGTDKVELHSLRVTMPLTPYEGSGLQVTAAIQIKNSDVAVRECAIVGCMSDGVNVAGDSRLDITNCLIAACWGTGISASHPNNANINISHSDIRNNYHYNIGLGVDTCVIEGCRISGTAWSGISCSGNTVHILRNAIFHNSRGIYSVGKHGIVRHNLFYQNNAAASCWSSDQPTYEGNLFLENGIGTVNVNGPGEPRFRNNLFISSPSGVQYGPMKITRGEKPSAINFHLDGNLFWQVESPAVLRKSHDDHKQDEPLAILDNQGNFLANPRAMVNNQRQVVISDGDIVDKLELKELQGISLNSQWQITPEEKAMIPEDGTVEASKWKKRPKL